MKYLTWPLRKILDWIARQFTEALPDDETINEQLDL